MTDGDGMKNFLFLAAALTLSSCGQVSPREAAQPPSPEDLRATKTALRPDTLDALVALLADKDGFRVSETTVQDLIQSSCSGDRVVDESANMIILDYRCQRGGLIALYAEFMVTQKYVNQIVLNFEPVRLEEVDRRAREGLGRPTSEKGAYVGWSLNGESVLPRSTGSAVPIVALQRDGDVATFSLTAEPLGEE